MQQLRQTGLGGNVRGETAMGADPFQHGFKSGFRHCRTSREGRSATRSNKAASQVIEKFRWLIGALAFADAGLDGNAWSSSCRGNELIHTTYLTVPTLPSLLTFAYAIVQTSGFCGRATCCNGIQIMYVPNNGRRHHQIHGTLNHERSCHGVAAEG